MRILYGLDRVPRSLAFDDPRLPGVECGPAPLRLNTEPVPAAVLGAAGDGHAARVAAMVAWLQSLCGDYAVPQRRAIADYLAWTAAEITAHRVAIDLALQRYGGLYAAEDWLWSALRPLPRAWMLANGEPVRLGTAFWDGARLLTTGMSHTAFWRGERLPSSPFRLRSPLPQGEAA